MFSITNLSTNKKIIFDEISSEEIIEMQGRNVFSSTNNNIFNNWNKEMFVLNEGENSFQVNDNCEIEIQVQYPIFQ